MNDRPALLVGAAIAVACIAGLLAGCLPRGQFRCTDDNQCLGPEGRGVCEAGNVCSFPDVSCPLGRRYSRFAGGEASSAGGSCVQPRACVGNPVVELRAGGSHACLRRLDGSVHCWGRNGEGQLGDGTRRTRPVPTLVAGLTSVRALSLGEAHSCALTEAGAVLCWGDDRKGQLGPGPALVLRPATVSDLPGALELAAGRDFTCARTADGVRCWGDNGEGQLGVDAATVARSPAPLAVAGVTGVEQVVAGRAHACARLREGTPDVGGAAAPNVVCWGAGAQGQLGRGEGVAGTAAPAPVAGLTEVVELSAGENHTCARRRDGSIRCWGDNSVGQLGDGTSTLRRAPVAVALSGPALRVRAGGRHACAVDSQEAVYCWGDNHWGQLGDGSTLALPAPARVAGLAQVLELAAGGDVTCALTRSSAVLCWGDDRQGQLGVGSAATVTPTIAEAQPPVAERLRQVSAGEAHTCGVRDTGEAICWGAGQNGRLGDGRTEDRPAPVTVRLPAGLLEVRAGGGHSCGRTVDREVWCWGRGDQGQLGTGELGDRPQPVQVRGLSAVDQLALGAAHSCAISRGRVLCWGAGDRGQSGQLATTPALTPAAVGGLEGVVEIAAGDAHTCARDAVGAVACWGAGESGQLGGLAIPFRPTPARVLFIDRPASALALGRRHGCALVGSSVECWGDNSQGQLGFGAQVTIATSPLTVPEVFGGTLYLGAAADHSCAVNRDADLVCWGASDGIQLSRELEPTGPVVPPRLVWTDPVVQIAAGGAHICLADVFGATRCFGQDDHGQLGRDRLLLSSRPRAVALACP